MNIDVYRLKELMDQNLRCKEIALKFKVDPAAVYRLAHANGLHFRSSRAHVMELIDGGINTSDSLAESLKMPRDAVTSLLIRMGNALLIEKCGKKQSGRKFGRDYNVWRVRRPQ